ncbi:hypothetical protein [Salininema proteolyticum]|uniref:Uncharacterized protein n=1 Tax=Salininema proteolyticum TaxID=1607685 RepID=A0ABV8U3B1_9ACTN
MDWTPTVVAALRRQFVIEETDRPAEFTVTAVDGRALTRRPRLVLPAGVLAEFLRNLAADADICEGMDDAVGMVGVFAEESLCSLSGPTVTTLGVHRDADGTPAWFDDAEPLPAPTVAAPGAYAWQAHPPDGSHGPGAAEI